MDDAASAPAGFVIDDDDAVRASIEGLLKSRDLRSETFGTSLRKQEWEKKDAGRDASATKTEGEEELIRVRRRRGRRLGGGR
jgi:FixJ family two-component response regulator